MQHFAPRSVILSLVQGILLIPFRIWTVENLWKNTWLFKLRVMDSHKNDLFLGYLKMLN
jgi:hypothetical protein